MKYLISTILIFLSYLTEAQIDSLSIRSTPIDSAQITSDSTFFFPTGIGEYGLYYEAIAKTSHGPEGSASLRQQSVGICYKRLNIGFFKTEYFGSYSHLVIFPNEFDLKYQYGGGYLGLHFYRGKIVEATLLMNVGRGDMIWKITDSRESFFRDEFMIYEPELHLSLVPIKYVKLFFTSSYRKLADLKLSGISASQFDGMTFGAGIRIGIYK